MRVREGRRAFGRPGSALPGVPLTFLRVPPHPNERL